MVIIIVPLDAKIFFNTILQLLPEESSDLLKNQGIDVPQRRKPLFDYISFCKYLRKLDRKVFQDYNDGQVKLLRQEIYKQFISYCSKLILLDTTNVGYPLHECPRAVTIFSDLYELHCSSDDNASLFFGLARICKFIEKFYIKHTSSNLGLAELIKNQLKIKYIMLHSDINYHSELDKYEAIGSAILKHAHNLIYVSIPIEKYLPFLNDLFLGLNNMQKLELSHGSYDSEFYKQLTFPSYPNLRVIDLNLSYSAASIAALNIILKSHNLQIIVLRFNAYNYSEHILLAISQCCPKLKYLQIYLDEKFLSKFQQVLINCQFLEGIFIETNRKYLSQHGIRLLEILTTSAPLGLYKINIDEKSDNIEMLDDVINHYKNVGVIKEFGDDALFKSLGKGFDSVFGNAYLYKLA
ncbi:3744_t:CDS:2 [Funneliformis geosporum]|uniref:3744_t:CDS:1 n=1 Tax=Funneliformis geosporum TaxID=1117311 RepID=A0A9W4T0P7_9GLOM|nr:3744_t:CDS:2 [Funneliformis geosporum]